MTTHRKFQLGLAATALAAVTALTGAAAFGAPPTDFPGGHGQGPNATAMATAPMSEAERADLVKTREEERLARELYLAFGEKYPEVTSFKNIAASEARHAEAAGRMLTRYTLDDPSANSTAGKFADLELQKLYTKWYDRGMQSKDEAIKVGIELEDADIAGLKKAIETSDNADLDQMYGNLLRASEHHLATYQAVSRGETPANGQCQQDGTGQGPGQGNRQGQGFRHGQR